MELKKSLHASDELYLTPDEVTDLARGLTLYGSGVEIRMKKHDVILKRRITLAVPPCDAHDNGILNVMTEGTMNVKFTLDGESLKIKNVEMIK